MSAMGCSNGDKKLHLRSAVALIAQGIQQDKADPVCIGQVCSTDEVLDGLVVALWAAAAAAHLLLCP